MLAARAAGTTVTLSDPQTVTLTAGLNDLTLAPLAVGENQRSYSGAPGDTAALLSFEELPTADDLGTVATLGAAASGPADITNGLTDKLAIRTTVTISRKWNSTTVNAAYAAGAAHKISVTGDYVPFAFYQNTRFSGKTITRLELFVRQVNAIDANQAFTVHRVKAARYYSSAHDDRGKLYAQAPAGAAERLQSERGQQMDLAGCEYPGWRGRDACVCGQERCSILQVCPPILVLAIG